MGRDLTSHPTPRLVTGLHVIRLNVREANVYFVERGACRSLIQPSGPRCGVGSTEWIVTDVHTERP